MRDDFEFRRTEIDEEMITPDREGEIRELIARGPIESWQDIVTIWSRRNTLYTMPLGPDSVPTEAYLVLKFISESIDKYEAVLSSNLTHPNPLVCAYCLTILSRCDRLSLTKEQISHLEKRSDSLEIAGGCFSSTSTLSGFFEREWQYFR